MYYAITSGVCPGSLCSPVGVGAVCFLGCFYSDKSKGFFSTIFIKKGDVKTPQLQLPTSVAK